MGQYSDLIVNENPALYPDQHGNVDSAYDILNSN